jgi:hypothetical protein
LAFGVYHYGDEGSRYGMNIHLGWPSIHMKLPVRRYKAKPWDSMGPSWGVSLFESSIHLNWGDKTKIVDLPWNWGVAVRHSNLLKDGTWDHDIKWKPALGKAGKSWSERREWLREHEWSAGYPYRYVLKSGEVQDRIATVTVDEMEWRQHWLQWTRLFAKVRRCIGVDFNGEVGERSGSWKGGCTGCSYELRPGETPEQCLRRMEAERKF